MKPRNADYQITVRALANQKKITCNVCGLEFTPLNDKGRYTVVGPDGALGDAFDCPQCGCQINVNGRYDRYEKTRKSYEKAYDDYEECLDGMRKKIPKIQHTFSSVRQFTRALEDIHDCMDDYGYIHLAAFKSIIGESGPYTDELIGWNNILDMKIKVDGNGYTLIMPPFNWKG